MNRLGAYLTLLILVMIIRLTAVTLSLAMQNQKPNQPFSGPGGANYLYSELMSPHTARVSTSTGYLNLIQTPQYLHP